jgi:N6-adenosine-specific RNA methylase IME4
MPRRVDPGTDLAPLLGSLALPSAFAGTGLELPEGLPFAEWERIGDSLAAVERTVGWWIGDWWAYGEHRYGERAKAAAESRFAPQTLMNYAWVARTVESSRRREGLSFSHHEAVANLPRDEQELFLDRAAAEGLSRAELRKAIKVRAAASIPLPEGKFQTITADPPWEVGAGPGFRGTRARPLEYPTMPIADIAALPVVELAAEDAHLYLWTINAYVEDAYAIARGWGFEPSTLLTWAKKPLGAGLGPTFGISTEFILFARRGSLGHKEHHSGTCFHWKRGRHSEKPEAFYREVVEKVSPGPYLELFGRRERPGWTIWGSDLTREAQIQGVVSGA